MVTGNINMISTTATITTSAYSHDVLSGDTVVEVKMEVTCRQHIMELL